MNPTVHGHRAADADPLNQRGGAKTDEHTAAQVGPEQVSTLKPPTDGTYSTTDTSVAGLT
jgi:hypothetical protein